MKAMNLPDVLAVVGDLADDVVAPEAEEVDRAARWPERCLRALQGAGLGGLVVPTESGGLGHGLLALARVCEVLGARCASTALCYGMHCVGSAVLAAKATEDQKQRYLVPISDGRHITTLALSEPGTGAHFYIPQARLTQASADLFTVDGVKCFVTNGGHADSHVVSTAPAHPEAPPGRFSCVIVPTGAPGVRFQDSWSGWGMRGNSALTMALEATPVPRSDLLGSEGDEIWYVFRVVVPFFLMAMAGTYLGIATAAFEEARRHVNTRRYANSGFALGASSVLQHRMGMLWAQLERSRQLLYHAATSADAHSAEALPLLFSAKAEVSDCAVEMTNEAMTLMGGIAYRESSRIQRLLRDARAAHVMAPTTDMLRTWAGRALLGRALLGDY
jgi:alkylation response protein AidB-like acyl-CoA dehydrogenase